jgi:putative MFS transporter
MSNQKMLECYDAAPLDKRFWFAVEGISLVFFFEYFDFYIVGFLVAVLSLQWLLNYG